MLKVATNPCATCPYRTDTAPGIWDASEYAKLVEYDDDQQTNFAVFLCHSDPAHQTACKGWCVVAKESVAARLAVLTGQIPDAARHALPTVPLYPTGRAAMDAGLRGVKRPGRKARAAIAKLVRRNRWRQR